MWIRNSACIDWVKEIKGSSSRELRRDFAFLKRRLPTLWTHSLGDESGVVQRDLYSAFLAAIADQNLLHPSRAAAAWPAAQSLLARAGWVREQPVSVAGLLAATSAANKLPAPEPVARERAPVQGDTSLTALPYVPQPLRNLPIGGQFGTTEVYQGIASSLTIKRGTPATLEA
jgi:hypothetical protein